MIPIKTLRSRNAIRRHRVGLTVKAEDVNMESFKDGFRRFFAKRGLPYNGYGDITFGNQEKGEEP